MHSLQSPGLVLLHHHALAPDELARLNDSYALALQNRSVTLKSWSPQPSEPQAARHSRGCPALPEADPKPVPAGQVLEGQSPDGQLFGTQSRGQFPEGKVLEGQGRGQFPKGQVLEGQGRGLFLGPPAQRWASDSALKESMNRLPTVPEGEEDGVDEPDSAPHLLPCASGSGSPTDAPGKETLQLPAGRSSCTAHSSMSGKTKRRVSFAVSRVQHYPADQENVPV